MFLNKQFGKIIQRLETKSDERTTKNGHEFVKIHLSNEQTCFHCQKLIKVSKGEDFECKFCQCFVHNSCIDLSGVKCTAKFQLHTFHETIFKMPTFCKNCDKLLWDFQGLKCESCGFTCHKTKCANIESVNCRILKEKERRGNESIILTTNEISQQAHVELEMFKSNSYEIRTHSFREATFKIPTRCGNCDKMIVGIYKQMMECEKCGFVCHKRECNEDAPNICPKVAYKDKPEILKTISYDLEASTNQSQIVPEEAKSKLSHSSASSSISVINMETIKEEPDYENDEEEKISNNDGEEEVEDDVSQSIERDELGESQEEILPRKVRKFGSIHQWVFQTDRAHSVYKREKEEYILKKNKEKENENLNKGWCQKVRKSFAKVFHNLFKKISSFCC